MYEEKKRYRTSGTPGRRCAEIQTVCWCAIRRWGGPHTHEVRIYMNTWRAHQHEVTHFGMAKASFLFLLRSLSLSRAPFFVPGTISRLRLLSFSLSLPHTSTFSEFLLCLCVPSLSIERGERSCAMHVQQPRFDLGQALSFV